MPAPRFWRALSQAQVVTAALIGLVTGVLALVFQLAPWLKPDPRDRVGAEISISAIEPNVTIKDWIVRKFPVSERKALIKRYPDRSAVGELLYVHTSVDGHKHRDVILRFDIYFVDSQRRVRPEDIDAPIGDSKPQPLSAPNERSVTVLWVPDFTQEKRALFIRVELWDENGILAVADSPCMRRGRFQPAPEAAGRRACL